MKAKRLKLSQRKKGNEAIAEYMKVKKHTVKTSYYRGYKVWYTGLPATYHKEYMGESHFITLYERKTEFQPKDLRYDCDWNWLMPVIERINTYNLTDNTKRDLTYTINYLLGSGCGFTGYHRVCIEHTLENLWDRVFQYCIYVNTGEPLMFDDYIGNL